MNVRRKKNPVNGIRNKLCRLAYRLPVLRALACRMAELERKNEQLSAYCAKLQEKSDGLDYRIEDVYHQIFLNQKEMSQCWYRLLPRDQYPEALKEWYLRETGKKLDLEHPISFNEKIQWIKLYGLNEKCTQLADKYAVRDHIAKVLGREYLTELYGVWDTFDAIDFERLPKQFILKATHGSSMNLIVTDRASFDRVQAEKQFRRWLCTDYAFYTGFELHYSAIPRRIIAEEYLQHPCGGGLAEYKVYLFHGKPEYIAYYEDTAEGRMMACFDPEWNRLPYLLKGYLRAGEIKRPPQLAVILDLSRRLGREFLFLRADWYLVDGSVKFGEMTFTPGSGILERDLELDRAMGARLHL